MYCIYHHLISSNLGKEIARRSGYILDDTSNLEVSKIETEDSVSPIKFMRFASVEEAESFIEQALKGAWRKHVSRPQTGHAPLKKSHFSIVEIEKYKGSFSYKAPEMKK
jgi:hypothetical protein